MMGLAQLIGQAIGGCWRTIIPHGFRIGYGMGYRGTLLGRQRLRRRAAIPMCRQTRWRGIVAWVLTGVFAILILAGNALPTAAQLLGNSAKAPIVIDGRPLFNVGSSGNFTAEERAEIINQILAQELEASILANQPVELVIKEEQQQTILQSANSRRNLLTVTQADVIPGNTIARQAEQWRQELTQALEQATLERRSDYVRQALLYSAIVLMVALLVQLGLWLAGRFTARQLGRWQADPSHPLAPWARSLRLLLQLALIGVQLGMWVAVSLYVTDLFPQVRGGRYRLFDVLTAPIFGVGNANYSALDLLLLLALTIGLWFLIRATTQLFRLYILSRTGADTRIQQMIAVFVQGILMFLGVIVLLQLWGVDVRSLAIVASALGVGIGFGVQNITNNLISGLIIILERPIQVGDFVKVGDLLGVVERIGARSTEIRTMDQVTIIVPNSRFLEHEVINWNHSDPISRLRIPVGVAYQSDVRQVQLALLEAARNHPEVLLKPPPQVWFQEFGDSALKFELLVWIGEPRKQLQVKSDLYYQIEASLRRAAIEVPFPQRDIHLRSPQLDAILDHWRSHTVPREETRLLGTTTGNEPPTDPAPLPATPRPTCLGDITPEKLVAAMRADTGVTIADRTYRLNHYPACFVGSEAVAWLIHTYGCTREAAIQAGQWLLAQHQMTAVDGGTTFEDGYRFYRFAIDADQLQAKARESNQPH